MRLLTTTILLLMVQVLLAQNPLPHHLYLMNQSMINPAYTGINGNANLTLISRAQWVGVEGAPFLHTFLGSSTISDHSALGLSIISDNYGVNSDTEIQLQYAYRIEMEGQTLSFGLQGGWVSFTEDYNKLDLEVNDDPLVGTGRQSLSTSTFGFGMMYKSELFYLGLGIPKISGSDVTIEGAQQKSLTPTYNVSGGLFIYTLSGLMIKPSFLVSHANNETLIDLNGQMLIAEKIWLGATLRNFNSAGVNFIYTEDEVFHFGYSFQFPFNELGTVGYGTHELMLSIDMRFGKQPRLRGRLF